MTWRAPRPWPLRARRRLVASLPPLAILAALAVGPWFIATSGAADLSGFDLLARAPAVELSIDSGLLPAPTHPAFDGTVPETSASLETGPIGHGLASMFWPGALGGYFGTAVKQLNQLCTTQLPISVSSLPPACLPIPQGLKDNASAFNDPVKAETFFPGGPVDARYPTQAIPGVSVTSHAGADAVESIARIDGFAAPGLGSVGLITARSITSRTGSTAASEARSEVSNVVLAGGLVTVDHITSWARETTDGQHATGQGHTIVSGVNVAGVPATVDERGLHISGPAGISLAQVNQTAAQLLDKLGLTVSLVEPRSLPGGSGPPSGASAVSGAGSFAAPVLVVRYQDDHDALLQAATGPLTQVLANPVLQPVTGVVQTPLVSGAQSVVTIGLGGATASVSAAVAPGGLSAALPLASAGAALVFGGAASGAPASAGATAAPASSPQALAAAPTRPAVVGGTFPHFAGTGWELVVGALALALAIGVGLYRLSTSLGAAGAGGSGSDCPR